jgi:hypothetical protein
VKIELRKQRVVSVPGSLIWISRRDHFSGEAIQFLPSARIVTCAISLLTIAVKIIS